MAEHISVGKKRLDIKKQKYTLIYLF